MIISSKELVRIEGHGKLIIEIENGKVKDVKFRVLEPPRLFEAFLIGRNIEEVPYISSKICGLCGYSHALCSVKALEKALKIEVPIEVKVLREIIEMMSVISSHIIHIFALSLPDFINVNNFSELLAKNGEIIKEAFSLKQEIDYLLRKVCGDSIHPINLIPGGFSSKITMEKLNELRGKIEKWIFKASSLANKVYPLLKVDEEFRRSGLYASLISKEYTFYIGDMISINNEKIEVSNFKSKVNEKFSSDSTSKKAFIHGKNFMVGALARLNLNNDKLSSRAKEMLRELKLKLPSLNPKLIPLAQLIEIIHCLEKILEYLNELKSVKYIREVDLTTIKEVKKKNYGVGMAIIEAPRGILYHEYEIRDWKIIRTDIITPTVQNIPDIESSVKTILSQYEINDLNKVKKHAETIVRCYDPCLSCSTHVVIVSQRHKVN